MSLHDEAAERVITESTARPDNAEAPGAPASSRPALWQLIVLVAGLCLISGLVGWWIGQPDDPSYNDVDTGFLADMITHHQGAVELGFAYLPNEDDSLVGHFAREIITDQSKQIDRMNQLLGDAGNPDNAADDTAMDWMGTAVPSAAMPGMATQDQFESLRAARGIDAADQFTELMIRHHAAGAEMADFAARHGRNEVVRRLAESMATIQQQEIAEMNHWRTQRDLPSVDATSPHDHTPHTG